MKQKLRKNYDGIVGKIINYKIFREQGRKREIKNQKKET